MPRAHVTPPEQETATSRPEEQVEEQVAPEETLAAPEKTLDAILTDAAADPGNHVESYEVPGGAE
jgi:hypothetical protein